MKKIFDVCNEVTTVKAEWTDDPREPGPWHVITIGLHASHFSAQQREAMQAAAFAFLEVMKRHQFPAVTPRREVVCSACNYRTALATVDHCPSCGVAFL